MRVTKEVKEALFAKVKDYSSNAKDKYADEELKNLIEDLVALYKKKTENLKHKSAEEAIKEIEQTHSHKFQKDYLDDIRNNLIKGYSWKMEILCASKKQEANSKIRQQIDEQTSKEKQDLILKLPFLKKEEELKEYMKGIEERLNAI